jgi:hypothetical protein
MEGSRMTGIIAVPGVISARDATLIKAVVSGIMPEVRSYIADATAALAARVAELEVQLPVAAPLTVDEVRAIVGEHGPEIVNLTERVGELENPEVVAGAVREATASLLERNAALEYRITELEKRDLAPPEKGDKGADCDMEAVAAMLDEKVAAAVDGLPPPEPGRPGEVDMGAVAELIDKAVATLPKPQDGKSVEPDDVREMVAKAVSEAVERLPAPKDGIGLADVLRDAEGNLVVVMTDGRTKSLGKIDGEDGKPGCDGLGFDDLNVEQIGERTVRFLLKREADEAEFDVTFPVPIYRGVFKEGEPYEPGDLTTWGGSLWHLNEAKGLKPGAPDSGWQLAAKAGRPGKDAGK